ncbi:hypothetical protein [Nocardiopsis nanhaiensis]
MDDYENPPVHPTELLLAKITLAVLGMAFVAGLVSLRLPSELAGRLAVLLMFAAIVLTGIALHTSACIKRGRRVRAREAYEKRSRQNMIDMLRAAGMGMSNTVNGPVHGVLVQGFDTGDVHLHDPSIEDDVPDLRSL